MAANGIIFKMENMLNELEALSYMDIAVVEAATDNIVFTYNNARTEAAGDEQPEAAQQNAPINENNAENIETTLPAAAVGLPKITEAIVNNDKEAADLLYPKLRERLKANDKTLFFKIHHTWTSDERVIDRYVLDYIMTCDIRITSANGDTRPYSQSLGTARRLLVLLKLQMLVRNQDPLLPYRFVETTRGLLCFLDGVLDFNRKRFMRWERLETEIFSTQLIPREFEYYFRNPDVKLMNEIHDTMLEPLFGSESYAGDNTRRQNIAAMQTFARGAAGYGSLDKNWFLYISARNTGKSCFIQLNKTALGPYCATFDSRNLLVGGNNTSGDSARKNGWLLTLNGVRLAFASEMETESAGGKPLKLNGDVIKTITGNDEITARAPYGQSQKLVINALIACFANDIPADIVSPDALQTCIHMSGFIVFKTQQEIDQEVAAGTAPHLFAHWRPKNPAVERNCHSIEWGNAYIMMLYQMMPAYQVPPTGLTLEINPAANGANHDVVYAIMERFTITRNEQDFVFSAQIAQALPGISAKKYGAALKALGATNKAKKTDGRVLQAWVGITLRV
jgi:hypothetical protein